MTIFLAVLKAIITRLVFATHGFVAIWQATTFKRNPMYWYLCCPIIMLFFEGIFTMTIKENQEWKWFCPSVFLYLCSTVPSIWLLELDKISRRIRARESNFNFTDNFDLSNLAAEDLKHIQKTLGVNIKLPDLQISAETWVTLIEQFLMLILIIGRWMLPKGDLTRDQLSQLLLVYIGTAADIIEFFDSFKEDRISREPMLVYLTLGIWTWSLMQFTVVLTATKSRKSRLSANNAIKRKATTKTTCCTIDVWGIALNMVLQDGPFLAFRLILIVEYKIVNYMNIFFTCKNTLVILLQLYRLYVVQSENKSKRKKSRKEVHELPSVSIISRDEMYEIKKHSRKNKKQRKKEHVKDIERGFSENRDSSEENDEYDSGPLENAKKNARFKKSRQDTGYSTSSSRTSYRQHEKSKKEMKNSKSSRVLDLKNDSCDEEKKRTKRYDKHSQNQGNKSGHKTYKKNCPKTESESSSEESDSSESSVSEFSDLENKERIRRKHRIIREDRK